MTTHIKTEEQINTMREGGKILQKILAQIKQDIKPGVETMELEKTFIDLCAKDNVIPLCKGYTEYGFPPFPTGLCVSINSQCVHCFPKPGDTIKDGDVVNIDTVIRYKGMCVDSSFAVFVTSSKDSNIGKRKKLVETSEYALESCIKEVHDGARLGAIGNKMYRIAKKAGFDVLRDYAGHGIGEDMHEWPDVPTYGDKSEGPILKEGMVICIEALLCSGNPDVSANYSNNGAQAWETRMTDGGIFAQFEHTILVTKDGSEVLTR